MERKTPPTKYAMQSTLRINELIAEYCDGNQQLFVEKTGINKGSVSQYVNGKNVPSTTTAKKIGQLFDVNPAWIMGFDVPRHIDVPSNNNVMTLSDEERRVILAYRNLSDVEKDMVCRQLQVRREKESSLTQTDDTEAI